VRGPLPLFLKILPESGWPIKVHNDNNIIKTDSNIFLRDGVFMDMPQYNCCLLNKSQYVLFDSERTKNIFVKICQILGGLDLLFKRGATIINY
jgi:hypothetical protein